MQSVCPPGSFSKKSIFFSFFAAPLALAAALFSSACTPKLNDTSRVEAALKAAMLEDTTLDFSTQPSAKATASQALTIQPQVTGVLGNGEPSPALDQPLKLTLHLDESCATEAVGVVAVNAVSKTPENGIAAFEGFTIPAEGTYYLKASYEGQSTGTACSESVTVSAAAALQAASLEFTQVPTTATAGADFGAIQVVAKDAQGGTLQEFTGAITLNVTSDTGCAAIASGTPSNNTVNASAGTATFSNFRFTKSGTYYLRAQSGAAESCSHAISSGGVTVSAGSTSALAFAAPMPDYPADTPFRPWLTVMTTDAFGNPTLGSASVTLSLGANPGAATLAGKTSFTVTNGLGLVGDFWIDSAANGYTLQVAGGGLTPAVSGNFDVTTGRLAMTSNMTGTTCSLRANGQIHCWGSNSKAQLGNLVDTRQSNLPGAAVESQHTQLSGVLKLATGYSDHKCVVMTDTTVKCWGDNDKKPVGDNTAVDAFSPTTVLDSNGAAFSGVSEVTTGLDHTCALKTNGEVYCWGTQSLGELGNNNTSTNFGYPVQVRGQNGVGYLSGATHIAAGASHTCAVTGADEVYCWGSNSGGQIGITSLGQYNAPFRVPGMNSAGYFSGVVALAGGLNFTCSLNSDSIVYCWGSNNTTLGTLGVNSTSLTSRGSPAPVKGLNGVGILSGITKLSVGRSHSCAIDSNNLGYCWGANTNGQLGTNGSTSAHRAYPVQMKDVNGTGVLSDLKSIVAGEQYTCAIKNSGEVYCWGYSDANLGIGYDPSSMRIPAQVVGVNGVGYLSGIDSLSPGYVNDSTFATCALSAPGGGVYCWGNGFVGSLGNLSTDESFAPVPVHAPPSASAPLTGIQKIASGDYHSCAVTSTGNVRCWGEGGKGQLGNNSAAPQRVPVTVVSVDGTSPLTNIRSVTAGLDFSCALSQPGEVYCWGDGVSGKLGDNGAAQGEFGVLFSLVPVRVRNSDASGYLSGVSQVEAGENHACAVNASGEVFCWGLNDYGQLGLNNVTNRLYPRQVVDVTGTGYLTGITAVSTAGTNSCALNSSGAVFCWGRNQFGQLGNNLASHPYLPVQVVGPAASGFMSDVVALASGYSFSCGLRSSGSVFCWGQNSYGTLGNNDSAGSLRGYPVPVLGTGANGTLSGIQSISAEKTSTTLPSVCGTDAQGTVFCWGDNSKGQLGINSAATLMRYPVQVSGLP